MVGRRSLVTETLLKIHQGGFPVFSARECRQELTLLNNGRFFRTLNGSLVHSGRDLPTKYQTVIKGKDKTPPAFDQLSSGMIVELSCLQSLVEAVPLSSQQCVLKRMPVTGSVRAFDSLGKHINFTQETTTIQLKEACLQEWFAQYRPHLTMMITHIAYEMNEATQLTSWTLQLEEV